jgi:hypothetical protein
VRHLVYVESGLPETRNRIMTKTSGANPDVTSDPGTAARAPAGDGKSARKPPPSFEEIFNARVMDSLDPDGKRRSKL